MKKKSHPAHFGMFSLGMPFISMLTVGILASIFATYHVYYGDLSFGVLAYYVSILSWILCLPLGWVWVSRLHDLADIDAYIQRNNVKAMLNPKVDALFSRFCKTQGKRNVLALALTKLKYGVSNPADTITTSMALKGERFAKASIFSKEWWRETFTVTRLL